MGALRRSGALAWLPGLIALTWWLTAAPVEEQVRVAVDDAIFVLTPAVAGWVVVRRAALFTGRRRQAWTFLAAGLFAWAVGEAVWGVNEVFLDRGDLFPSLADVGFLALPVAAGAALLVYPIEGRAGGGALRRILDGFIVSGALLLVSWSTVLRAVVEVGADDTLALVVSLAYPVADVALISAAVLVLTRSSRSQWGAIGILALGLTALAVADSAFAWLSASGGYASTELLDVAWYVAFAVMAVAARWDDPTKTRTVSPEGDFVALLLPYVPLGIAIVTLVPQVVGGERLDPLQASGVGVLSALVLTRQFITLRANVVLARELSATEEELRHLAFHDPLTGLANRPLFTDRLTHALAQRERNEGGLALLFVDLDDFKVVNDTWGHAAGDALLVQVSDRLRSCLRAGDTLARLGGDEFGVLLQAPTEDPVAVADRLLAALGEPFQIAGRPLQVRASIGVAALPPGAIDPGTVHLLGRADAAMYAAKRDGKGRVRTIA